MSIKVRINLREMYPKYYNQDCFVEVDQDVYETMNKYDHIDAVYKRKVDYHKGYFSLDRSPFLELEKEKIKVYMPDLKLCTDNGAMIGSAGYYNYIAGKRDGLELNAIPNLKLN